MSAWSEFAKKFALQNGISYTEASKLPIVKELYKAQKSEELKEQTAIFEMKLLEAIEIFEADTLAEPISEEPIEILQELIESVAGELPADENTTVTIKLPLAASKIFISKPKKVKLTKKR